MTATLKAKFVIRTPTLFYVSNLPSFYNSNPMLQTLDISILFYQILLPSSCKNIVIRKFKIMADTQSLYLTLVTKHKLVGQQFF